MELFTVTGKLKKPLGQQGHMAMVGYTQYIPPLPRDLTGTDNCSSEEYRCTHVDTCVART
jgi:hypothetical protein